MLLQVVEERVSQVDVVEYAFALVEGYVEAIQEILSVGVRELGRVSEARAVSGRVGVVLDSLNNVAEAITPKSLLGHNSMDIIDRFSNARQFSLINISRVHWVLHNSLVVWHGPRGR